jgi:hypothetical protein
VLGAGFTLAWHAKRLTIVNSSLVSRDVSFQCFAQFPWSSIESQVSHWGIFLPFYHVCGIHFPSDHFKWSISCLACVFARHPREWLGIILLFQLQEAHQRGNYQCARPTHKVYQHVPCKLSLGCSKQTCGKPFNIKTHKCDFTNDFIWTNFSWNGVVHNVRRILRQSGCWMRRTKRRSRKSRISLARRSTFRVAHAQQQSPNTCRTWPAISRMKSNTVKHQHSVKWTRWPHTMAISKVKLSSPLAEACVYSAWFLATVRAQSKLEIHRLFEAPVWSSDLLKFVFTSNAATSGQLIFVEPFDTNGELLLCTCHDTA